MGKTGKAGISGAPPDIPVLPVYPNFVQIHGAQITRKAGINWESWVADILLEYSNMEEAAEALFSGRSKSWYCSKCFTPFKRKYNCLRHVKAQHSRTVSSNDVPLRAEKRDANLVHGEAVHPTQTISSSCSTNETDNFEEGQTTWVSEEELDVEAYNDESENESTDGKEVDDEGGEDGSEVIFEVDAADDLFSHGQMSKITRKDHGSLVMAFAVRHNVSQDAIKDLLGLIQLHLPPSNNAFQGRRGPPGHREIVPVAPENHADMGPLKLSWKKIIQVSQKNCLTFD